MVNPIIRADFEQEQHEKKDLDSSITIPNVEETGTRTNSHHPETCPLWEQPKGFYTRNFPTDDVSFRVRMPVLGLVVTLIALHFFIITVGYGMGWSRSYNTTYAVIIYFAYFVLAAGVAFELWWGLKTNDKKHVNVWILLKLLEILATIYAYLYYIYDQNNHLESFTLFYYVPVMGLNSWIFYSVYKFSKHLRNDRNFPPNYIPTSIPTISRF